MKAQDAAEAKKCSTSIRKEERKRERGIEISLFFFFPTLVFSPPIFGSYLGEVEQKQPTLSNGVVHYHPLYKKK